MINLSDLRILVTRPKPQGKVLVHKIHRASGIAEYFPTITITPLSTGKDFQQTLMLKSPWDWLIFVSPQAVYTSAKALRLAWPKLSGTGIAGIGQGTAQALHRAGFSMVTYPPNQWDSEGLLQLPQFRNLVGKKIAIIRGMGGREILHQALSARGACVSHLIAYERSCPKGDISRPLKLLAAGRLHGIVAASGEGVKNLSILLGRAEDDLYRVPLIINSERIKQLAEDLGFQTIWVADNASHQAILQLLALKRNELCQIAEQKKLL